MLIVTDVIDLCASWNAVIIGVRLIFSPSFSVCVCVHVCIKHVLLNSINKIVFFYYIFPIFKSVAAHLNQFVEKLCKFHVLVQVLLTIYSY